MTTPGSPALPTAAGERLASLDFIRGIAVMGILGANIIAFGQPYLGYLWPGGFATSAHETDAGLWTAQFLLIDGKMRGLFTLLFGAGLVLFAERAAAGGAGRWLQVRRLAWLFAFGLLHFYLLWRGDILTLYALCGLLALFAVRWLAIPLIAAGLTGYLFGGVTACAQYGLAWAASRGLLPAGDGVLDTTGIVRGERADGLREIAISQAGSYFDYVRHALGPHRWNWADSFTYNVLETLPLMLLGMGLYRAGLFDGRIDRHLQARWGWRGVITGTALTALVAAWALGDGLSYAGTLFAHGGAMTLTRLPVVLGLAALLALWGRAATGALGSRVTAAGRMAFSNYVGTSLVMLMVFQGLGLFGRLGRVELYLVALATCAVMLLWSRAWLARFRHGPLEWLWRCLTYGRLVPLRR